MSNRPPGGDDSEAPAGDPAVRTVTPGMRRLFLVAGGLVTMVGISLFFFSTETDEYFAWTIATPLTAAFLGAGYLASAVFEWAVARQAVWAHVRVSVSAVFVFTVLTLVTTLLHLDRFHFGDEHRFITQFGTWIWLVVYAVVPVAMVVLMVSQRRAVGADPARPQPLPPWLRTVLAAQAAVLLVWGVALFLVPSQVDELWPWPITTLTGRAIAAWLLGIGVGMVQAVYENHLANIRVAAVSNVAIAVLQLVAVARYSDDITSEVKGTLYVLFLVSMLIVGAYASWARTRGATLVP